MAENSVLPSATKASITLETTDGIQGGQFKGEDVSDVVRVLVPLILIGIIVAFIAYHAHNIAIAKRRNRRLMEAAANSRIELRSAVPSTTSVAPSTSHAVVKSKAEVNLCSSHKQRVGKQGRRLPSTTTKPSVPSTTTKPSMPSTTSKPGDIKQRKLGRCTLRQRPVGSAQTLPVPSTSQPVEMTQPKLGLSPPKNKLLIGKQSLPVRLTSKPVEVTEHQLEFSPVCPSPGQCTLSTANKLPVSVLPGRKLASKKRPLGTPKMPPKSSQLPKGVDQKKKKRVAKTAFKTSTTTKPSLPLTTSKPGGIKQRKLGRFTLRKRPLGSTLTLPVPSTSKPVDMAQPKPIGK